MGLMKAHFIDMQDQLMELGESLLAPDITSMEARILSLEIEQLQHRLLWKDKAARFSSALQQG